MVALTVKYDWLTVMYFVWLRLVVGGEGVATVWCGL